MEQNTANMSVLQLQKERDRLNVFISRLAKDLSDEQFENEKLKKEIEEAAMEQAEDEAQNNMSELQSQNQKMREKN